MRAHAPQLQTLLVLTVLLGSFKDVSTKPLASSTSFSFAHELAHGTSGTIVVPGNHSVAGELCLQGETTAAYQISQQWREQQLLAAAPPPTQAATAAPLSPPLAAMTP
jgi:hypothetical protein